MGDGSPTFALIGLGKIARRHEVAIRETGGRIVATHDPPRGIVGEWRGADYAVITSPSDSHRALVAEAVANGQRVIVEKPWRLPWESPIAPEHDSLVNVCLQFRYLPLPPLEFISARFIRPPEYWSGWVDDPMATGGVWFHLFIHYVDLAMRHGCELRLLLTDGSAGESMPTGFMTRGGEFRSRESMPDGYTSMYWDIISGGGVRPSSLLPLERELGRLAARFGDGPELFNKIVTVDYRRMSDYLRPRAAGGRARRKRTKPQDGAEETVEMEV